MEDTERGFCMSPPRQLSAPRGTQTCACRTGTRRKFARSYPRAWGPHRSDETVLLKVRGRHTLAGRVRLRKGAKHS